MTLAQIFGMVIVSLLWISTVGAFWVSILSKDQVRVDNASAGCVLSFIIAVFGTIILYAGLHK